MGVEQWTISYYNPYTSVSEAYRIATGEPAVALISGISDQRDAATDWKFLRGSHDGVPNTLSNLKCIYFTLAYGVRRSRPECLAAALG